MLLLVLLATLMLSTQYMETTCKVIPNLYIKDVQETGDLICTITSTEQDLISEQSLQYVFKIYGLPVPEIAYCTVFIDDEEIQDCVEDELNGAYSFYFNTSLIFGDHQTHIIKKSIPLLEYSNIALVEFSPKKVDEKRNRINIYEVHTDFSLLSGNIMGDCTSKELRVNVMFARNVSKETSILINAPSSMSFPVIKKGNCTMFTSVNNVKEVIECESDGSELRLYNVINSNIFIQQYKTVSFKISDITCNVLKAEASNIIIQTFNSFHGIEVYGEKLEEPFAPTLINSCEAGTFYDGESCAKCPDLCKTCTSLYDCASCSAGNILHGICVDCPPNCENCIDSDTCNECSKNYNLYENYCYKLCPTGTYQFGTGCIDCSQGCSECNAKKGCTKCLDSTYDVVNGECVCSLDACKKNCPVTPQGCSICSKQYFYNKQSSECDLCNLEPIVNREPLQLIYNLCSGDLYMDDGGDIRLISDKGYSGVGDHKNNVCSVGMPQNGPIPPGSYNITSISCSIQNSASSRVLVLTPLTKFSNDSIYDSIFASLYIYSADKDDPNYSFPAGRYGLVVEKDTKTMLSIGDIINVTTADCKADDIKKCEKYPPPTIGTTAVSMNENNSFAIQFIGWGDSQKIDLTKFRYSAALKKSDKDYTELCGDSPTLTEGGMLCNEDNIKKLGYFNSGGLKDLRVRVKYHYEDGGDGVWATDVIQITITDIIGTENASEAIKSKIKAKNAAELMDELSYKKQAMDTMISKPQKPPEVSTCPPNYCQGNGVCTVKNNRPRCKCTSGFSGLTCTITAEVLDLLVTQNEEAATVLLSVVSTSTAGEIVDAVNSITGNTDILSDAALDDTVNALDVALESNSSSGIESGVLEVAATNIMSAIVKNTINEEIAARKLEDTNINMNQKSIAKIKQFKVLTKGFQKVIQSNAGVIIGSEAPIVVDIEGLMNAFYSDSESGEVLMDGANVGSIEKAMLFTVMYPPELNKLFPIPLKNAKNAIIMGNVVTVTTQSEVSPYIEIKANKSVMFKNLNPPARRLSAPPPMLTCGYYDESDNTFNSQNCQTNILENGDVMCYCSTENSNIYVVSADRIHGLTKAQLTCAIVIPIVVVLVAGAIVATILILKKKKANQGGEKRKSPYKSPESEKKLDGETPIENETNRPIENNANKMETPQGT